MSKKGNDEKVGNVDLDKLDMRSIEETEGLTDRGDSVVDDDKEEEVADGGGKKAPAKRAPAKKTAAKEEKEEIDEEEEESDDEESDDDESDDEEAGGAKSKTVPYLRFAQVNRARRDAEAKLAEVEERLSRQKAEDLSRQEKNEAQKLNEKIDGLYENVEKARAEGDFKEAAKLQKELDTIRSNISVAQSRYLARQEALRAAADSAYEATVTQLETVEPRLNPDSDEYDEVLVAKVDKLVKRFEKAGESAHEALREAAELALGYNPFKSRPEKKGDKKEAGKDRKEETIRRNAATSKKQPPDGGDNFDESRTKINVRELTDEEFNALPLSKRQQLRGDFL
jgi:hypothetical protein